jgi:inhibitor of cysteine peptidase
MHVQLTRWLLPVGLLLLAGCAGKPASMAIQEDQQSDCPLELNNGQTLMINLPSNPTTGFRWMVVKDASRVLQSMGPEVYTNPEDAGMVGSGGKSTWRFKAYQAGQDELLIQYQRPWEQGVAPAKTFACVIQVD